jgi:hypothetical protein
MMVVKLSELSLSDMDKEIIEIDKLIKATILLETGGVTKLMPTIGVEDGQMFDTTQSGARALEIKWLEEMETEASLQTEEMETEASLPACQGVVDAIMMEDTKEPAKDIGYMGVDLEARHSGGKVLEDTVEMMTGLGYMGVDMDAKGCQKESVVVVVSRKEDPHHHGGVLTPLHGPTTIPENEVEGDHVLWLHATEEQTEDKDITVGIKCCPGIEVTLPRYTY